MKYAIATLAFLMMAAIGCTQVPPNPTVYSCQNVTVYTPLNQATPETGLTYTDAAPAVGEWCYIAQSVVASTGQVSLPSNTAGPLNVTSGKSVSLSWLAPTTGPTPTGYILSRAAAVASTLAAPSLGTGAIAENEKPIMDFGKAELAAVAPIKLKATLYGR